MNDTTYLLDEALAKLSEIHVIQKEMADVQSWNNQTDVLIYLYFYFYGLLLLFIIIYYYYIIIIYLLFIIIYHIFFFYYYYEIFNIKIYIYIYS